MHEAAVANSILNIAAGKLKSTANAASVAAISVMVGEFRNVDHQSLKFAFDSLKQHYIGCEQCDLDLIKVDALASCKLSGHLYHPSARNYFRCDQCSSGIGDLTRGEELDVINITLKACKSDKEKCTDARYRQ